MERISRITSIRTILKKDLVLFTRDFLFLFLTILSLVTFVILFWVLPRDVDETISVGVRGDELQAAVTALAGDEAEGMAISWFDDSESLRNAVEQREVEIGLAFPDDFVHSVQQGRKVTVTTYIRPNLPIEISDAMGTMVREIAYALSGNLLPISEPLADTVVLGKDMAGNQIPLRDRMKPLYSFLMLIMESVALGALISSEIQERTITALLSTPARAFDILMAKMIMGTGLAFSEAMIVTILIGGFGSAPGIVILALFLGAILVTGIAMIAGSGGKELMSTMLLGIIILLPLAIPAFAVLMPGTAAGWVKWLPSYGVVQIMVDSAAGLGWSETYQHVLTLAGWCAVSILLGVLVLRRKAGQL